MMGFKDFFNGMVTGAGAKGNVVELFNAGPIDILACGQRPLESETLSYRYKTSQYGFQCTHFVEICLLHRLQTRRIRRSVT